MKYLIIILSLIGDLYGQTYVLRDSATLSTRDGKFVLIIRSDELRVAVSNLWKEYCASLNRKTTIEINKRLKETGYRRDMVCIVNHVDSIRVFDCKYYPRRIFSVIPLKPTAEGFFKYLEKK